MQVHSSAGASAGTVAGAGAGACTGAGTCHPSFLPPTTLVLFLALTVWGRRPPAGAGGGDDLASHGKGGLNKFSRPSVQGCALAIFHF